MSRKAYILTFDKDEYFDSRTFHNELTELPLVLNWFHYIKSSYIIITNHSTASSFHKDIQDILPPQKRFLLIEVNLKNRNGWLPIEAWAWLKKQANKTN